MGGNSTWKCPAVHLPEDASEPFRTSDGDFNIKLHYVGWIVAGFFGLIGSGASFWLIKKHLEFYTKPNQQKYIVRILFMVPCYALYSWFSYYWWKEALYFQLLRDCYEAVVIASFFSLLLYYLGDNQQEHALVFKNVQFKKWIWPLGRWRYKPSGPRFLSIMQWSIGQYWICRPGCTLAAVITEAVDLYCLSSWSPRFSHVWTSAVICISVTVAMYAVLQFYVTMKVELGPYQPMLKFFAVKSVVFLTFWGECLLVVLASVGVIKGNKSWSAHEIQVGISALISCFVMMIFGFLHVKSFTYLPYRGASLDPKERLLNKTKILPALGNVLDFRDVISDVWNGTKQIYRLCRGKKVEKSFIMDEDHLGNALGRTRVTKNDSAEGRDATKALMKEKTDVEEELERVKLSLGDDADQAFVSDHLPAPDHAASAATSPWQNITTAFTPLLNLTRTTSPAPSSALATAPTASLRSGPVEAINFGDVRRFPKSSTGILYPAPPPEQSGDQASVHYHERLEVDAEELVYGRPTSWFRRVFRRNGSGTGSGAVHTPLAQASSSRDDAVVEEILADRSLSYDYPSAPSSGQGSQRWSPKITSEIVHSRNFLSTRTGRTIHHDPSPLRDQLTIPDPLSPSRYPGFNEQAYVDRTYALHAVAMNVVSPPISQQATRDAYHSVASTFPPQQSHRSNPGRVAATFMQLPQTISSESKGPGSLKGQLPRQDQPPARFNPILPANLSSPSSRRPLPIPSASEFVATAMPSAAINRPTTGSVIEPQVHCSPHTADVPATRGRNGPVTRLGLGLLLNSEERPSEPQTTPTPRQTQFIYDEY